MKNVRGALRRIVSMMLVWAVIMGLVMPGVAAIAQRTEADRVTVSIEYIDEEGTGEYMLPPTQVALSEDVTLPTVLAQAYADRGSVSYSLLNGYTVTPKDGEAVGEVGWGKKAWWPFSDSTKVGNKYDVQAGNVIRLMYCQDSTEGVPGYNPPASQGEQGTLVVNKDKLLSSLAQLTQSQIDCNQKGYEQAMQVAVSTTASQEDVNAQWAVVDEMLKQEVPATGIVITPDQVELMVGQTQQLTAKLTPAETNDTVEWYSENTRVAQVTEQGLIRAVGVGTTVLSAQANATVKAQVRVTVTGVPTQSITLSESNLSLKEGQGQRLKASVTPEDTTDLVVWTSSNSEVASVDETGMVVGIEAGTAEITATSGTHRAVCTVTVTSRTVPDTPTVVFQHTDGRLTYADENNVIILSALDVGKFVLEGVPEGQSTYWSCSEKEEGSENFVVHISTMGKFYPHLGVRPACVYDKNPEWYESAKELASFTLKVEPTQITALKVYQNGWGLDTEEPVHLSGTESQPVTVMGCVDGVYIPIPCQALVAESTEGSYIYDSFDDDYCLEFFAEDEAMHTFSISVVDNPQVKCSFQATAKRVAVTGMTVEYPKVFYIENWNGLGGQYVGITSHDPDPARRYEINLEPYNATVKDVRWVSHDPDIAEFQETYNNGIVPKKPGTARFTVTSVDNPAVSQELTIRFEYKHPLEQVEVEQKEYKIPQFETMDLNLLVTPANATNQRFSWSYSKEGIVEVHDYVSSTPGTMTTTHTLSALEQGTVTVTGTPLDTTNDVQPVVFTVTVSQPEEQVKLDFETYVTQNISHSLQHLKEELKGHYTYGAEWSIFAILRAGGSLNQKDLDAYYADVCQELHSGSRILPTDLFRIVTALQAMGKDPTNVDGVNVIEMMCNYPNLDRMTSNMMAFTLLALDTKDYTVPEGAMWTRETLVEKILTFQNECGGFGLSSADTYGVDITAMLLQALAPYRGEERVDIAFDKALDYLREEMTNDAGYINEGDDNGCSAAQVLTALAVAGIDPLNPDNGFTRGNHNLVVKLNEFKRDTGFTTFMRSQEADGMGTVQIGYALEAYRRMCAGENSLYDMTGWTPAPPTTDGEENDSQEGVPENGGNMDAEGNGSQEGVPETGDPAVVGAYVAALTLSAVAMAALVWDNRKKRSK